MAARERWNGRSGLADGWGADVGKTLTIGSQTMSLQVGAYDLVKHPEGDPTSIIRVQVTLLFPTGNR